MQKLLTIAIPTYNRAALLDRQLAWLSRAIQGFENQTEIFVSDNCSTDHTQQVIAKWKDHLKHVVFNSNKNAENIGVMRNIMLCLSSSQTKYVWAIGDDDPIQERAVSYAFQKFKQFDDLSLLYFNFSGRNQVTGEPVHPESIVGNRWFDITAEDGLGDGKEIFQHCISKSVGAVIFLTATVFRSDLVERAHRLWPDAVENWMYLAYLSGYCAANGKMIVTKDNFLECIVAASHWEKIPQSSLLMQYKHFPDTVQKLVEVGYSKKFGRAMLIRILRDAHPRVLLGAVRRWPVSSLRIFGGFLGFLCRAIIGVPSSRTPEMEPQPTTKLS